MAELAAALGASAKRDEVTFLPVVDGARVAVVGLGDADVTPAGVRLAVGTALRKIAELPEVQGLDVAVSLELTDPELLRAAGEGALLGAYAFQPITATSKVAAVGSVALVLVAASAPNRRTRSRAPRPPPTPSARPATGATRPPTCSTPRRSPRPRGSTCATSGSPSTSSTTRPWSAAATAASWRWAAAPRAGPRLVRLSYAPRGAETHLALVGKGITFDSGGLDIKPAGQMAGMKFDMSGAGAVVAATRAIAALGLKIKVTAYAALAENMPSGSAYRSSDVLTMFDGQTVENFNTDAEGRLVMADAIARAGLDKPDLIVDVATLTGACMVALGMRTGGLLTNGEATSDLLLDAAEAAGEDFWELPITEHTREQLKSTVADMKSGAGHRWGGALVAAAFLERFVPDGVAWAHLDIAGPAENPDAAYGYVPKGGTGAGVRTLVSLAGLLSA